MSDRPINPYLSPSVIDDESTARSTPYSVAAFFLLPVLGGICGFCALFATELILDHVWPATGPTRSYGILGVLVSLPLCTLVGGALGCGLACAIARMPLAAIMIWICAALLDGVVVAIFWSGQVARYGLDRSDVMLFGPPLALAAIAVFAATLVGVLRRLSR